MISEPLRSLNVQKFIPKLNSQLEKILKVRCLKLGTVCLY